MSKRVWVVLYRNPDSGEVWPDNYRFEVREHAEIHAQEELMRMAERMQRGEPIVKLDVAVAWTTEPKYTVVGWFSPKEFVPQG